ncbi:DUF423 domain-containing protein [Flavobacterium sp.]|uniref:DUF423 domain-containing protein n=1 Tax=Flavobacterium sp. TaxID=239 RepID=UPI00286C0BA6|nr:DUF423 domain-containing protein [Flavobacterium sp.]
MNKKIILTALIFGIVSIVLGAFGAHALKKILSVDQLASFEVGVKYLMYEAFFLLFIGTTSLLLEKQKRIIFYFALFGSVLFSGSIFLLTTKAISGIDFKFLGPITPIGGLLIIVSWGITFYYIVVKKV